MTKSKGSSKSRQHDAEIEQLQEQVLAWKRREREARILSGECMLCPHLGAGDPLVDPVARERDDFKTERDLLVIIIRFLEAYLNPPTRVNRTYDPVKLRKLMKGHLDTWHKWVERSKHNG